MWKALLPGEKPAAGDTIRYQPSAGSSYKDKIYEVVKVEVHYFEVITKPEHDGKEELFDRKVIKYMDIGYHLALELWSGAGSLSVGSKNIPA